MERVKSKEGGGILALAAEKDHKRVKRMRQDCSEMTAELKGLAEAFDYLRQRGEGGEVLRAGGKRIAALEERLAERFNRLLILREEIEKDLERLEGTASEVMRFRYVEGLDWNEICERANFSRRAVFYIHSRALERLCGGQGTPGAGAGG